MTNGDGTAIAGVACAGVIAGGAVKKELYAIVQMIKLRTFRLVWLHP